MNHPKTTSLKLLQGNPGKRPINENEPKPAHKIPLADHLDDIPRNDGLNYYIAV